MAQRSRTITTTKPDTWGNTLYLVYGKNILWLYEEAYKTYDPKSVGGNVPFEAGMDFYDRLKQFVAREKEKSFQEGADKLLEKAKEKYKRRKPTHGTCCTCQNCGYAFDNDCICEELRVIDNLETIAKDMVQRSRTGTVT